MPHSCLVYLIPWFIAFFLTMIFIIIKESKPHYECYWLIRLLEIIGGLFVIIGALSFSIPAMIGLNLSLFCAGSLMINFTLIANMANDKQDSK